MSKKGGSQTVTNTNDVDPFTQNWMSQVYGAANGAANSPYKRPPGSAAAGDYYSNLMRNGNLGMGAMTGDPNAIQSFMNPYTHEVLDRVEGDQKRLSEGAITSANDYATKAGAFGGSRHGVAEGTALAETERTGADRMAGLRVGGYNDAMGRASEAANLGFSAAPMMDAYGRYDQQMSDPNYRRMTLLREGMMGLPYGSTSTSSQPMRKGWGQGAIGGATAGFGMFGPWGALGGGLLGAFGG